MAASGSKTISVTSWLDIIFEWEETATSTSANTSTVSWELYLSGSARISSSASKDYSVTVNGSSTSGTYTIGSHSGSWTKTIKSGTATITHDSDGSKTFSYSFSVQLAVTLSGTYYGTKSGSGTGTLTTIPRASTLSVPTVTLGSAATLTITRASSSFTHTITVKVGSSSAQTICTKSSSTSISWTPSIATYAPYITTATSATATYTLETFSGSTSIGTATATGTMKVPSSVVPTVSSITLSDAGSHPFTGLWVKSLSKVKAVISATTAYSSSIKTYKFVIDSLTASGSSSTLTFSSALSSSGTVTGTATITDARGRTGTGTKSITVYSYYAPTIDLDIGMDDTTLSIGYTWSVADVNKTNTYALSIKVVKTSTGSTVGTYTPQLDGYTGTGTLELTLDDLQYETYTVTATLTDKVQSVSTTANSGQVALSFRAGGLRATFFGQRPTTSSWHDYSVSIMSNPDNTGNVFLNISRPSGMRARYGIGGGGQNHGVYSDGYVTDDNLANNTYTDDALWEIYRNSSGNITIGNSSHSCYASGGFVSGGHNSVIGSTLSSTVSDVTVSASTNVNLTSLSVPAGTWVLQGSIQLSGSSTGGRVQLALHSSSATGHYDGGQYVYVTVASHRATTMRIITITSTTTYYFVYNTSIANTVGNALMRAVRIA